MKTELADYLNAETAKLKSEQKQTGHTPGPWKVHRNIGRKGELGVMANTAPCIIACMGNAKAWPVEAEANARLIAAAPALLEALKHCTAYLELDADDEIERRDARAAREAIDKATRID